MHRRANEKQIIWVTFQNVAAVEAFIDFSEDDNIEDGVIEQGMEFIQFAHPEFKLKGCSFMEVN